ncbi:hypothetical protein RB620_01055 [Paenibacillus sp. LHD-117]|uniref:hypothetical protein n=1 Tax=Paenibacillus sp. LHD-117 TaxID=3071412 RepID=UPI0027E0B477|nr:hypothetical protein [Paenibacillus sp. LHD-117]MDQ6418013.1 hypothetical protein [Paenibacillus sp. LHD-117]
MLNPREEAIVIWIIIFLLLALFIKGFRSSIPNIIKSFYNLLMHPIFIFTNTYIVIMFLIMYFFEILEIGVIKDYILWIFMALYPLIFKVTSKLSEVNIGKLILESFKLSVIPVFIINEYTLPLWIELILVPFLVLIGGIIAVNNAGDKNLQLHKFLNFFLVVIGIIFVFVAFKGFIFNLHDATKVDFYEKMFFDIIGVLLHAPLLLLLQYMCLYENLILRTNLKSNKILTIFLMTLSCRFNKQTLKVNLKNHYELRKVNTIKDLKIILQANSMKS